jgi:hypothetical protein
VRDPKIPAIGRLLGRSNFFSGGFFNHFAFDSGFFNHFAFNRSSFNRSSFFHGRLGGGLFSSFFGAGSEAHGQNGSSSDSNNLLHDNFPFKNRGGIAAQ